MQSHPKNILDLGGIRFIVWNNNCKFVINFITP
jgi:hypothetical protein